MKVTKAQFLKWAGGISLALASLVAIGTSGVIAFFVFDQNNPPPKISAIEVSTQVVDADGKLLRAFVTKQGRWRLQTRLSDIDSEFLKLLIAYEDQRFWTHRGVDPLAMLRAMRQLVVNGRIISGASTITMQLARLLEPRTERSLGSKLHQALRALQLEARLTKNEILTAYLTLAPYGGNLEGIRAASLAYFGKEPKGLTLAQSALLVALPQSPERRRPDRFVKRAKLARDTVLTRAENSNVIAPGEVARAASSPVSAIRHPLPKFAAHLAQRLVGSDKKNTRFKLSLKRKLQRVMEDVTRDHARRIDANISIALILADAKTGDILAQVGSPDYLDARRSGWVDMTQAIRSPGSVLKPFIYGLAFEEGLAKPETLIMDSPANFSGYRPQNFDMQYQGEVSIRKALQLSLNVPAVHLLEAVGPTRLLARIRQSQIEPVIAGENQPGLAIALGGIGFSLHDLTQLYTAFANGGWVKPLHHVDISDDLKLRLEKKKFLQPVAAWYVNDILSGAAVPKNSKALGIAYKTGTSYGYRDAWSIGYDGRHVLGVWVGRADNGSVPGITGRSVAAPILFDAFARSGIEFTPFKPAPVGAQRTAFRDLPVTLQRFGTNASSLNMAGIAESEPLIVYPPQGARVELAKRGDDAHFPLVMKLQNGRPPFRWLANGKPFSPGSQKRVVTWIPDGTGFSTLTVIDAVGRANSVNIFIAKVD